MNENNSKKTRVMFVLPGLLPGGIERHTIQLLKHLDRSRFDLSLVTLFTIQERPTLYNEVPSDVSIHRLSFKSSWSFSGWGALHDVFLKERPDVVVSSMFSCNTIVRLL